ncbi:MAG: tryptophan 2,3-dioxygenase family protein [Rhodothermales bacterium]
MTDRPSLNSDHDSPWWDFAIDPTVRDDVEARRLTDADGMPLVNAPDDEGRLGIDYPGYLGLDLLLGAQVPASRVPDERVFIITHQLFELVFKQMIFDLGVVARTMQALLDAGDDELRERALEPLPDDLGPSAFWRPAMTAAGRLRHAARRVLPAIMTFMGRSETDDVLFSTLEYERFRDFLAPASGFQTAQLRLIQRALGKNPILRVHVFPGDVFGRHYTGCPVGHVSLGDPLVLRSGHSRAFPAEGAPAQAVAELDRTAHAVLARLAPLAEGLSAAPSIRTMHGEDVTRAVSRLRATLGEVDGAEATVIQFRGEMESAAREENERRAGLGDARRGAQALHARHRRSCLAFVLDRISATDAALHAPDGDSFLTVHRKTVRRHVAGDGGTGGGGMPYLVTSQRFLLPLFPALVAYTDLGTAGTDEDGDRW